MTGLPVQRDTLSVALSTNAGSLHFLRFWRGLFSAAKVVDRLRGKIVSGAGLLCRGGGGGQMWT